MKYYLYILRSVPSNKYYIGSSKDPFRRLQFHNTIERGFTSRFRPWEIFYTKVYRSKKEANEAELKVKSWKSREMISKLVHGEIQI